MVHHRSWKDQLMRATDIDWRRSSYTAVGRFIGFHRCFKSDFAWVRAIGRMGHVMFQNDGELDGSIQLIIY